MHFTITLNGESVTLSGVTDGATIDLTPQSVSTVQEVTCREWVPSDEVRPDDVVLATVDATETTPQTTVAPKGVNRSEGKRTQSKPKSKTGPIKGKGKDPIGSTAPRSPMQQAGNAKGRHDKYGSGKTATEWLALAAAAVAALSDPQSKAEERKLATATERHAACLAQLRSEGYISPKGKTVKV